MYDRVVYIIKITRTCTIVLHSCILNHSSPSRAEGRVWNGNSCGLILDTHHVIVFPNIYDCHMSKSEEMIINDRSDRSIDVNAQEIPRSYV